MKELETAAVTAAPVETDKPVGRGRYIRRTLLKHLGRLGLVLLTVVIAAAILLYAMLDMACHGPSKATGELFATTILETGALKWMAGLVMTDEEIMAVLDRNALVDMDTTIDESLIQIAAGGSDEEGTAQGTEEEFDIDGVEIIEIQGRTFKATMIIVNDPSRISVGTSYIDGWWQRKDLGQILDHNGALGGVNGGLYDQKTYMPLNIAVSQGEVVHNTGGYEGLYIIGFDTDNMLRIIPTGNASPGRMLEIIEENNIRDAVAFSDYNGVDNAHFVPLVINGVPRETSGMGSGANPRTAIGQRADGSVLLLVTDGRGADGHLGATAADLIDIMMEYGAVNAANIDGGSSSAMYYEGEYLMTSTTLYYANSSYKLPTAFMIEER